MNIQTKQKINSTGSMSVDISQDGAVKLYSYQTVVGYVKNGKVVLRHAGPITNSVLSSEILPKIEEAINE